MRKLLDLDLLNHAAQVAPLQVRPHHRHPLLVDTADLGRPLDDPQAGDSFQRHRNRIGGRTDRHLSEVLQVSAFRFHGAHADVDLAVLARQFGGHLALQLVSQQRADGLNRGTDLGDPGAVEQRLYFWLAPSGSGANVHEAWN